MTLINQRVARLIRILNRYEAQGRPEEHARRILRSVSSDDLLELLRLSEEQWVEICR